MPYIPNAAYAVEFTTSSPTTGAAVNADSLPVATANKNAVDDAGFVLTVTSIDTGRYSITGTIPGTYVAGDVLNVSVAATVAGIAGKAIVDTQVLGPALSAADVRTAIGLASANLDTQLDALPTSSELTTALATSDDATLAALAAMNNLSQAEVRSAVGLASANLDTQLAVLQSLLDTDILTLLTAVSVTATAIQTRTDLLPDAPAATGDAMTLTTGERDSISAALLDLSNGIEVGLTLRQALRLIAAACAGKASGLETDTATYRNAVADDTDRLVATVDEDGNRTAITYTVD